MAATTLELHFQTGLSIAFLTCDANGICAAAQPSTRKPSSPSLNSKLNTITAFNSNSNTKLESDVPVKLPG
jgi:hypothetical protein